MFLTEFAETHAIPKSSFTHAPIDPRSVERILVYTCRFFERYGSEIVLYGGQTATEYLYGYYRMRSCTTDLDYFCTERGIAEVAAHENRLRYHPEYDILFTYVDTVPVTFSWNHIHDCQLTRDFFDSARILSVPGGRVLACSREYSIILKLRRSESCIEHHRRLFGKDAIDIINMIAGAALRPDRPQLDIEKLLRLSLRYVSGSPAELKSIFTLIEEYADHLPRRDVPAFTLLMHRIYAALDRAASASRGTE